MNNNEYPILAFHFKILQMQYLLPKRDEKPDVKLFCLLVFRILFATPFMICMLVKEIQILNDTGKLLFDYFLLIFSQIGNIYGIFSFGIINKKFLRLYYSIIELDSFGVGENHNQFLEKLNFYSKLTFAYSQTTIFIGLLSPIIEYDSCMRKKKSSYSVCGVLNIWAPFDITVYPNKLLVYLMNAHNYFTVYSTILTLTFFSFLYARYLLVRLQFVEVLLRRIPGAPEYRSRRHRLLFAIQYHQRILSNSRKILDLFSGVNLLYIAQSGVVLGTTIYGCMTEFNLIYLSLCYGYSCQVIINCYSGQKLMEACENIGMVMYTEVNWHEWEVDLQKHVICFLNMCQRPIRVKSGPFGYLNFTTIIMLAKSAYSFCMMMKSLEN